MGTSFSVVYAVIFMIWLETPIVNDVMFRQYIRLYKQFIDDLFLMWTVPAAVLCDFRRSLDTADVGFSLDWSGCESHQEAVDPSVVMAKRTGQLFRPGHEPACGVSDGRYYQGAIPTLPQAGQRLCLHTLHVLPWTPCLPGMGAPRLLTHDSQ